MSFSDVINQDIQSVFLNTGDFAEVHTIIYYNDVFENVPVALTGNKYTERTVTISSGDHAPGMFKSSLNAYISLSSLNGVVPERGKTIKIDDGKSRGKPFFRKYKIAATHKTFGMIKLELEAIDE